MPTSLKAVLWWALALLFFLWVFRTPGAAHSVTNLFSSLMAAIVGIANSILHAITSIIPSA